MIDQDTEHIMAGNLPLGEITARAIRLLLVSLGPERLVLLARLLSEVTGDTQYGAVEIVIAAGRVQNIKSVKSYKANPDKKYPQD